MGKGLIDIMATLLLIARPWIFTEFDDRSYRIFHLHIIGYILHMLEEPLNTIIIFHKPVTNFIIPLTLPMVIGTNP